MGREPAGAQRYPLRQLFNVNKNCVDDINATQDHILPEGHSLRSCLYRNFESSTVGSPNLQNLKDFTKHVLGQVLYYSE